MTRRVRTASCLAFFAIACWPLFAGAALLTDPDSGCAVDIASARPDEPVRWTGACLEGLATGRESVLLRSGYRVLVEVTYRGGACVGCRANER